MPNHELRLRPRVALTITLASFACTPRPETRPPPPTAVSEEPLGPDTLIAVAAVAPVDRSLWRFDAHGDRVASSELEGCMAWDVVSGRLVADYGSSAELDDSEPCTTWHRAQAVGEISQMRNADGLVVSIDDDGSVIVRDEATGSSRSLPSPDPQNPARAASWSPDGQRLLVVRAGRAESWEPDASAPELSLRFDESLANRAVPLWLDAGPLVVVEDYSARTTRVWTWPEQPDSPRISDLGPRTADELLLDPSGRWAWWPGTSGAEIVGLRGESSGLPRPEAPQRDEDEQYYRYTEQSDWWSFDGGVASWLIETREYNEGSVTVSWEAWRFEDAPTHLQSSSYHIAAEHDFNSTIGVSSRQDGGLIWWGWVCDDEQECDTLGSPPSGCLVVDHWSRGNSSIVVCGDELRLYVGDEWTALPFAVDDEWTASPFGLDITSMWSRSGAMVVFDDARWMGFSPGSLEPTLDRSDVHIGSYAALGLVLDRYVLGTEAGVELLDLSSSPKTIFELPGQSFVAAALSPDGTLLALLGADGRVRVYEPPDRRLIAEWAAPTGTSDLAFRADQAVLFCGDDLPRHAFEPRSGRAVDALGFMDRLPDRVHSDWTWHYIAILDTGEIVRTLDGRRINVAGGYMPDTGRYRDPQPPNELLLRFADSSVPEVYPAAVFERWLYEPRLFERFFGGEPLPYVSLSNAERARLRADE